MTSDLPLPGKTAGNYPKVEIHPKPSFVVQIYSPKKISEFVKVKARYKILILKLFQLLTSRVPGTEHPRANENNRKVTSHNDEKSKVITKTTNNLKFVVSA